MENGLRRFHQDIVHLRMQLVQDFLHKRFYTPLFRPMGSLVSATGVRSVSDLDLLLCIDANIYSTKLSTTEALELIGGVLAETCPVFVTSNSLVICFEKPPNIEIVPAYWLDAWIGNETFFIPDEYNNTWIISRPFDHAKSATTCREETTRPYKAA